MSLHCSHLARRVWHARAHARAHMGTWARENIGLRLPSLRRRRVVHCRRLINPTSERSSGSPESIHSSSPRSRFTAANGADDGDVVQRSSRPTADQRVRVRDSSARGIRDAQRRTALTLPLSELVQFQVQCAESANALPAPSLPPHVAYLGGASLL